jgi:hypothetical protein
MRFNILCRNQILGVFRIKKTKKIVLILLTISIVTILSSCTTNELIQKNIKKDNPITQTNIQDKGLQNNDSQDNSFTLEKHFFILNLRF